MRTRLSLLVVLLAALALGPGNAVAKGGEPELRSSVSCGGGVTAELRLRARSHRIRARFEVAHGRAGTWHIVLVHEHRVAWRSTAKGSFELERSFADYPGSDAVTARATGPRGTVCQVTGLVPEVSNDDSGAQGLDG